MKKLAASSRSCPFAVRARAGNTQCSICYPYTAR